MKQEDLHIIAVKIQTDVEHIVRGIADIKIALEKHIDNDTGEFEKLHTRINGFYKYVACIGAVFIVIGWLAKSVFAG